MKMSLEICGILSMTVISSLLFVWWNKNIGSSSFLLLLQVPLLRLLLSEVSELNTPPSSHTAEGSWLHVPVFNRVGKQTNGCVQVLLDTGPNGTEVIDSNTADFVSMEENHLNRQDTTGFLKWKKSMIYTRTQTNRDVLPPPSGHKLEILNKR